MQILVNVSTNKNTEFLKQRNEKNPKQISATGPGSFLCLVCRHVAHDLSFLRETGYCPTLSPQVEFGEDSDLRFCILFVLNPLKG